MRQKAYYTSDETFNNLYTTGQEWMTEDAVEYKGKYHKYITGEVYTESEWSPSRSIKLIKFEVADPNVVSYKKIKPVATKYKSVQPTIPVITNSNRADKYIYRYFIKKINESSIIEIDESQYKDWTNKKIDPNLYVAVKMIWHIAGPLTAQKAGQITVPPVAAQNAARISNAEKTMPGLSEKLNNLLEYYSDDDFTVPQDINA